MSKNTAILNVLLGIDSSQLEKSLANVSKKLTKFGKDLQNTGANLTKTFTAPILGAATAIVGLATKAGYAADKIFDLSDQTGLSTDLIQQFRHVAAEAGVSTDVLANATMGLIGKLKEGADEGTKIGAAIKELGVNAYDMNGNFVHSDELMSNLISKLSQIEDPIKRNAEAAKLFGGQWKDLAPILGLGSEKINELINEASNLGIVLSGEQLTNANKFRAGIDKLKNTFDALLNKLGADFAPFLNDTLLPLIQNNILPTFIKFTDGIRFLFNAFTNLPSGIQKAILIFGGLLAALGPVLFAFGTIIKFIPIMIAGFKGIGSIVAIIASPIVIKIGLILAAIAAVVAIVIYVTKNFEALKERAIAGFVLMGNYITKHLIKPFAEFIKTVSFGKIDFTDWANNLIQPIPEIKTELKSVKDTFGEVWEGIKSKVTGNKILEDPKNEVIAFNENLIKTGGIVNNINEAINHLKINSIGAFTELSTNLVGYLDEISLKTIEVGSSFLNMQNYIDFVAGATNHLGNVFEGMFNAILGGNLFNFILDYFKQMLVRMAAMAALALVLKAAIGFGGGAGVAAFKMFNSGGFGNIFSGLMGFSGLSGGIGGRKNGGAVSAGNPYLVGEMGRELFVPSTNGTIISNANLGGNTNVNVTGQFKLTGNDMLAFIEKNQRYNSRTN